MLKFKLIILLMATSVGVMSFGIARFIRATNSYPEPAAQPPCPKIETITSTANDDLDPRWSPDGKSIAFVGHHEGNPEVYVMDIATRAITNLSQSQDDDYQPMWSPDGHYLAFFHRQQRYSKEAIQLRIIDIATGHIQNVTPDYRPIYWWNVHWSEDGQYLRFLINDGAFRYSPSTDMTEADLDKMYANYPGYDPSVPLRSPDGRRAWIGLSKQEFGLPMSLFLIDDTTGEKRQLMQLNVGFAVDSWSPTRDQIAFYSYAGVYVVDVPTGNYRDFIQGIGKIETVDWSPDGNYLASRMAAPGSRKVAIADIRSGAVCVFGKDYRWMQYIRRPVTYTYIKSDPQWSPNGDQVVISSGENGNANLILLSLT